MVSALYSSARIGGDRYYSLIVAADFRPLHCGGAFGSRPKMHGEPHKAPMSAKDSDALIR
jgi:hypothetical protein